MQNEMTKLLTEYSDAKNYILKITDEYYDAMSYDIDGWWNLIEDDEADEKDLHELILKARQSHVQRLYCMYLKAKFV